MNEYNYRDGCICPDATLLDALKAINAAVTGIALVINAKNQLVGIVVDGDIRRALIAGASLDTPVAAYVNRDFVSVGEDQDRAAVLDLMQARSLDQIPVLDVKGRLVGLHTMRTLLDPRVRPNWAVIMAGGKGTRLRPITEHLPKPMVLVAGRPILERIVLHLVSHGIRRIFLSVNYLAHIIEDHFGDGNKFGCKIEYLREDEPLGTGGALSLLPEIPKHPMLVMNGDLVMQTHFGQMLKFHEQGQYFATMGLRPYTHEVAFGCAQVENGCLKSLVEKPVLEELVNAGVYVLSSEALSYVPTNTFFPITQLFEKAIQNARTCGAYLIQEDWADIGLPQQLKEANGVIG